MTNQQEHLTVTVDFKEIVFDKEGLLGDVVAGMMLGMQTSTMSYDRPDQMNIRHHGKVIATLKRTKKAIVMPTEKTEEN